jgi:hypothetical protein
VLLCIVAVIVGVLLKRRGSSNNVDAVAAEPAERNSFLESDCKQIYFTCYLVHLTSFLCFKKMEPLFCHQSRMMKNKSTSKDFHFLNLVCRTFLNAVLLMSLIRLHCRGWRWNEIYC